MKHNKFFRRGLALFMALVMCLSLLPATAMAEELLEQDVNTAVTQQDDDTAPSEAATEDSSEAETDEDAAEAPEDESKEDAEGESEEDAEDESKEDAEGESEEDAEDKSEEDTEDEAEEVPAAVQEFLNAVAALPDASEVTQANAEEIGEQVNEILDMWEALVDEDLADREDVNEALNTAYAVFEAVLAAAETEDADTYVAIGEFTGAIWGEAEQMPTAYATGISGDTFTFSTCPVRQTIIGNTVSTYYADAFYYKYKGITDPNNIIESVSCKLEIYDGSPGYGTTCLDVNIETKENVTGTANVKVLVVYYIRELVGVGGSNGYFGRLMDCTVTVTDDTPPDAPNETALKGIYNNTVPVEVRCSVRDYNSKHSFKVDSDFPFDWFVEGVIIGDVVRNTNSPSYAPASRYPWMCTLTLDKEFWVDLYNEVFEEEDGVRHYLDAGRTGNPSYTLYSDGLNWYGKQSLLPMTVWITHSQTSTSYTIVHEYYANNEKKGEVTETVKNAKAGQTIYASSITKKTTFNGNQYTYTSANPESLKLVATAADNVITLRYDRTVKTYEYRLHYNEKFPDDTYDAADVGNMPTPNPSDPVVSTELECELTISSTKPTRTGYEFKGWKEFSSANKTYQPGDTIILAIEEADADSTSVYTRELYPVWEKIDPADGLTVNKTASKTSVAVGEEFEYTVTVKNGSGKTIPSLTVYEKVDTTKLELLASVVFPGNSSSYNKESGLWTINNLANGDTAKLTLRVKAKAVNATTVVTNTAQINKVGNENVTNGPKDSVNVTINVPDNPSLTGLSKVRVTDAAEIAALSLTGINTDTPVEIGKDETATLLYKITVTGEKGAKYVVNELGNQNGKTAAVVSGSLTGTLGESGKAEIYVTMTFDRADAEKGTIANKVTLEAGENTQKPTGSTEGGSTVPGTPVYNVNIGFVTDEDGSDLRDPIKGDYEGTWSYAAPAMFRMARAAAPQVPSYIPKSIVKAGVTWVLDMRNDSNLDILAKLNSGLVNEDYAANLVYSRDMVGGTDASGKDIGDGIPDKYQAAITIEYKTEDDKVVKTDKVYVEKGEPYDVTKQIEIPDGYEADGDPENATGTADSDKTVTVPVKKTPTQDKTGTFVIKKTFQGLADGVTTPEITVNYTVKLTKDGEQVGEDQTGSVTLNSENGYAVSITPNIWNVNQVDGYDYARYKNVIILTEDKSTAAINGYTLESFDAVYSSDGKLDKATGSITFTTEGLTSEKRLSVVNTYTENVPEIKDADLQQVSVNLLCRDTTNGHSISDYYKLGGDDHRSDGTFAAWKETWRTIGEVEKVNGSYQCVVTVHADAWGDFWSRSLVNRGYGAHEFDEQTTGGKDISVTFTYVNGAWTPDASAVSVWVKEKAINATVTGDYNHIYNGKEQGLPEDKVTVTVGGEETDIFEITGYKDKDGKPITGAPKDAGEYIAVITVKDKDGNVLGTVEVPYAIAKRPLTVTTESGSKTYDGTALTAPGSIANLVDGETVTLKVTGSQTDAGSSENTCELTWDGSAKESNYVVDTESLGTLTVGKRPVTVTTESASKTYDGTALTAPGSVDGLVDGETVTLTVTGSQTIVGSSDNTYTLTWDGSAKESNYEVAEVLGTLTVNQPGEVPDPTPVVPDPVIPTPVPGTPAAVTPAGTTINDEEIPLAGTVGLNDVEHFAYIIGYDDGTVRPLGNITRAEAVTIFFRLMTDEHRAANWSTTNSFNDANVGNWFNNAVSTVQKAGALEYFAQDASFLPNQAITRAEFASIAAGFISDEFTGENVGDFSDTEGHWAAEAIRKAVEAGWITGDGNKFRPDDTITRAEVMIMVNRMLDRVPDAGHMLSDMTTWSDNLEGTWYYEAVQEATNGHAYERDEMGVVETWTELLDIRDWKALEEEWAMNSGASASEAPEADAE